MSKNETRFLLVVTLAALSAVAGCSRKSGDGTGSESGAPAPEVVMPETSTAPAVETAPTLAPESTGAAPTTNPTAGMPTTVPATGTDTTSAAPTSPTSTGTTPPAQPSPTTNATDPLLSIAQSKAATIDSGLAGYTMHNQPQVIGDVHSDVSIYSSAGSIVYIEEKQTTSDNSISTNKYYFDNGKLFYYQDDGRWLDVNPPNPLTTRNTRRNMAFTAGGKLITAAKTIDGVASSVSEYEAVAVLTRAEQLLGPLPTAAANNEKSAADKSKAGSATAKKDSETIDKPKSDASTSAKSEASAVEQSGSRIDVAAGNKNQLHGTAPVRGTRDYVIHAKAGQLLTLGLEGGSTAVFAVYSNRGEIVSDLTNWSSKLPRDGDYTIKVGQKAGSAPADFVLNLKLE